MITDSDTVVATHIMHDIFGMIFGLIIELCLDLLGDELCRRLTMTKILYAETAMFSLDCFDLEVAIIRPSTLDACKRQEHPSPMLLMIIRDLSDLRTLYSKFARVANV